MRTRVTDLLFASIFYLLASSAAAGDSVGEFAPNWILPDVTGKTISLYEETEAGKTTVMFFWASWCKSCKSLLPVLQELDKAKGERPISFYLMNVWEDNDPLDFLKRFDIDLPVLLQAENVAQRYDVRITPGVVVVGPERRILYVREPEQNVSDITSELQRVLGIALKPREPAAAQATQP